MLFPIDTQRNANYQLFEILNLTTKFCFISDVRFKFFCTRLFCIPSVTSMEIVLAASSSIDSFKLYFELSSGQMYLSVLSRATVASTKSSSLVSATMISAEPPVITLMTSIFYFGSPASITCFTCVCFLETQTGSAAVCYCKSSKERGGGVKCRFWLSSRKFSESKRSKYTSNRN